MVCPDNNAFGDGSDPAFDISGLTLVYRYNLSNEQTRSHL